MSKKKVNRNQIKSFPIIQFYVNIDEQRGMCRARVGIFSAVKESVSY